MSEPELASVPQRAIDKVRAHYHSIGRRHLHVLEWQLDIYADPMLLSDTVRCQTLAEGEKSLWFPAVIVTMAKDVKGEKLFHFTDMQALADNGSGPVVTRVGMWLLGPTTEEDHEGN